MRRLFVFVLPVLLILTACSEPVEPLYGFSFQKTIGGTGDESGNAIASSPTEGYYYIGGSATPTGETQTDVFICKTDSTGKPLWANTFGGSLNEAANAIIRSADGTLIVAGTTQSFGAGFKDAFLAKILPSGEIVWANTYGGKMADEGFSVVETLDNSLVMVGSTQSFGAENKNIFVVKTASNGQLIWSKTFGQKNLNVGRSVALAPDGNIVIAGGSAAATGSNLEICLLKLNQNGEIIWTQTYGGLGYDLANALSVAKDGQMLLTGSIQNLEAGGNGDLMVMKTNIDGGLIWNKLFGGGGSDIGYSIQQDAGGNAYISGMTASFAASGGDIYLMKVKPDGSFDWSKSFGELKTDVSSALIPAVDEGFALAGSTRSYSETGSDLYFVKTDRNANTGACNQTTPATTETALSLNTFSPQMLSANVEVEVGAAAFTPVLLVNQFKVICETK